MNASLANAGRSSAVPPGGCEAPSPDPPLEKRKPVRSAAEDHFAAPMHHEVAQKLRGANTGQVSAGLGVDQSSTLIQAGQFAGHERPEALRADTAGPLYTFASVGFFDKPHDDRRDARLDHLGGDLVTVYIAQHNFITQTKPSEIEVGHSTSQALKGLDELP